MGDLRLTVVRASYTLGCASCVAGVVLPWGLAVALIVAGVIAAGTAVMLADDA